MIDLSVNAEQLEETVKRLREKKIILPTFAQMKNPNMHTPSKIKNELENIGLWDVQSQNLFRINWKNQPIAQGGKFNDIPNYIEIPSAISGVKARILALVGKWFPTGSHKVGATYGCLAPRLITGQFNPVTQKAVWPSTGNYCRGGAYNSTILACESIAILPEEMSQERFNWLKKVAGEVIPTPGCESNVKEIYDKCHELMASPRGQKGEIVIFNQFDEFANYLWHYDITGHAMEEVLQKELKGGNFRGITSTTGSAGTIASGDYLKKLYPKSKIAAGEALQCPTLLINGYGGHRIEGIGDKHIPWIHNTKNTDLVIAVDDEDCIALMRLFNEPEGQKYLRSKGVSQEIIQQLNLLGISSIANMIMAIKMAQYYEMGENDVIITVFTDSMEMYQSRLQEQRDEHGDYSSVDATKDYHAHLLGLRTDNMTELTYVQKRAIHNLKYFTWIEQQGKTVEELNRQWYDSENYWGEIRSMIPKIDELITATNKKVGLN
jgi:cysteine synthase